MVGLPIKLDGLIVETYYPLCYNHISLAIQHIACPLCALSIDVHSIVVPLA